MDISFYDFFVLFIIVPFLLYKFTGIPQWLFNRAKRISPKRLLLLFVLVLLCFAVLIATLSDSVWNVRLFSLGVATLACLVHYIYTEKTDSEKTAFRNGKDTDE